MAEPALLRSWGPCFETCRHGFEELQNAKSCETVCSLLLLRMQPQTAVV